MRVWGKPSNNFRIMTFKPIHFDSHQELSILADDGVYSEGYNAQ